MSIVFGMAASAMFAASYAQQPAELAADETTIAVPVEPDLTLDKPTFDAPAEVLTEETPSDVTPVSEPVSAELAAFTPMKVMLNEEMSSQVNIVDDMFTVTVLEDVLAQDTIVIPKGSIGRGRVSFSTAKGGFGKPGIIALSLMSLDVGDRTYSLDGRYREEGKNKNGAVAATWFAVGIFSGFIKGKAGSIERGRELKARTGEPIPFIVGENAAPVLAASDAKTMPAEACEEACPAKTETTNNPNRDQGDQATEADPINDDNHQPDRTVNKDNPDA